LFSYQGASRRSNQRTIRDQGAGVKSPPLPGQWLSTPPRLIYYLLYKTREGAFFKKRLGVARFQGFYLPGYLGKFTIKNPVIQQAFTK